ncbi:hypothetical protein DXX98_05850 [Janibacter melonis]|nr:hypothetical protein [Janibacter melonis]
MVFLGVAAVVLLATLGFLVLRLKQVIDDLGGVDGMPRSLALSFALVVVAIMGLAIWARASGLIPAVPISSSSPVFD